MLEAVGSSGGDKGLEICAEGLFNMAHEAVVYP